MSYKLLIVSPTLPYDKVGHAGGKTHNYYLKRFHQDQNFTVKLISFEIDEDNQNKDLDNYGIDHIVHYVGNNNLIKRIYRVLTNFSKLFNPFDKFGGLVNYYQKKIILKTLHQLKDEGYIPDFVLLEWTSLVLLIEFFKEIYPEAKYIASEHDVTFLGFQRKYLNENNSVKRILQKYRYDVLYNKEMSALKFFDLIVPHNFKDRDLLIENGLPTEKIHYISPYFMQISEISPHFSSNNILFFGLMDRMENFEACIWFIKNVFSILIQRDPSFRFYIVGKNPPQLLRDLADENIIVTGFVDDIKPYFENSLCMVAPLSLGAGIKVKIVEGMAASLPVLTSDVGIEGIPAYDGVEFLLCKTAVEYVEKILYLKENKGYAKQMGENAKQLITSTFDMNQSFQQYRKKILELIN